MLHHISSFSALARQEKPGFYLRRKRWVINQLTACKECMFADRHATFCDANPRTSKLQATHNGVVGRPVTTLCFHLLRVTQHFTHRLVPKMTTISSANSTEMGPGESAPQPEEPTATPERSLVLHSHTGARPSAAANPTVSLVIPVRNEARNIGWVLEQITYEVTEIIVVDGNSTDVTLVTARRCRPDIRVVPQQGAGKGSALRTGFLAATGDIIVMMDADGSMSPAEIPHYVHFLANGYDFVKGSRFISGGSSLDITWFRRLGNRFLLAVFNALYDGHLTDLCYGFCAFDRRYLDHLDLSATGFEIEAEITVRAMQAGLRITEVPSIELPRRSGKSNLHAIRDGIRVLRTVLRDHRSGVSGHLVQAARQVRYAARSSRAASTAMDQQ